MNPKTIKFYRITLATLMSALIPWIITLGNPLLPVILVVFGLLVTWIIFRKDQKTLVDERAHLINQQSSTKSMSVFLLGTTFVGLTLLALSNGGYPEFSPIGYTLLYCVCGLLVLNLFFGAYYRHKYGG